MLKKTLRWFVKILRTTHLHGLSCFFSVIKKTKDRTNLLLYFKHKRLVRIEEGLASFSSGRVAVFVMYQKECLSFSEINLLKEFKKNKVDCFSSINQEAPQSIVKFLKKNAHLVVVRKNFGRDFGAYKDTLSLVNLKNAHRLIIANDSVFYFSKNLSNLFTQLIDTKKPIVAMTCSKAHKWHVQSYLFSLSSEIFSSREFKNFWKNYIPFNSRVHAVHQGEIKFSQDVLSKYAKTTHTIYNLFHAAQSLSENSDQTCNLLSPEHLRKKNVTQNHEYKKKEKLLSGLEDTSPSHSLALFCAKGLGFCILKKDITFRKIHSLSCLYFALTELEIDSDEIRDALHELGLRGKVDHLNWIDTLQVKCGHL